MGRREGGGGVRERGQRGWGGGLNRGIVEKEVVGVGQKGNRKWIRHSSKFSSEDNQLSYSSPPPPILCCHSLLSLQFSKQSLVSPPLPPPPPPSSGNVLQFVPTFRKTTDKACLKEKRKEFCHLCQPSWHRNWNRKAANVHSQWTLQQRRILKKPPKLDPYHRASTKKDNIIIIATFKR